MDDDLISIISDLERFSREGAPKHTRCAELITGHLLRAVDVAHGPDAVAAFKAAVRAASSRKTLAKSIDRLSWLTSARAASEDVLGSVRLRNAMVALGDAVSQAISFLFFCIGRDETTHADLIQAFELQFWRENPVKPDLIQRLAADPALKFIR